MNIYGIFNISCTDNTKFMKSLSERIIELQNDGQTVEVQYKVNRKQYGELVYSALILGRK